MRTNIDNLEKLIGKIYFVRLEGLDVKVRVKEARWAFGRIDVLIEPIEGRGSMYKQLRHLKRTKQ